MKKLLSLLIAFLLLYDVSAQNLDLSFTGVVDQSYIALDSIKIMNRTKDCDTLLVYPDTLLSLTVVGVNYHQSDIHALSLSQNFPNPFADQTSFSVFLPDNEYLHLMVHNLMGQKIAEYHAVLDAGQHHFTFYPAQDKFYINTAVTPKGSHSIKMSCMGSASSQAELVRVDKVNFKSASKIELKDDCFGFEIGDTMLFVGYTNTFTGILESGILDTVSGSKSYTFQFAANIPCPGTPTVDYEGQIYNTIQIFSQCWLKENLNVGVMKEGWQTMTNNGIKEKYCYLNKQDSCSKYGGLYLWDEVMQYSTQQGTQGICPEGWHIPTDDEWKVLEGAVGQYLIGDSEWDYSGYRGFDAGSNLKTEKGWYGSSNGTNLYSFWGLPGGCHDVDYVFYGAGEFGYWWTSSPSGMGWHRKIEVNTTIFRYNGCWGSEDNGFSVRCIKN